MNLRSETADDVSDRALALALGAASALALGVLFWPAAVRRVFVYSDLGNFFLPFRIFLAENLERGITPLWMPNLFCGFYAHGEGQIGIFHPLRWLLYRLLPIDEGFNAECLIPFPFALAGAALFLRRLALPLSAAIFGGLSFAFSAYMTVRLTHLNALTVLAHLGWLLFAIDMVLRERGRKQRLAWGAVAVVTGSQLLVGYPAAIAYCWMVALPYALFVSVSRGRLWPAVAVAGALGAGLLLGGIQLWPTWNYLASSLRAEPTYDFLTKLSLHPVNLVVIVAPWLFRDRLYMDAGYNDVEQALYFGPVVPIAALWVVLRSRQLARLRPPVAGLLALSALALVLAFGKHTVLYRYFLDLPLIGLFRVPARYSLVLYCTGAAFGAMAFAELLRADRSPESRRQIGWIWTIPALSWLVAVGALALGDPIWEHAGIATPLNSPRWILLGPLSFTLAAALFTAAAFHQRAALFGLAVLALADQTAYAATLWWAEPPRTVAEYRSSVGTPAARAPFRIATAGDIFAIENFDGRWRHWTTTRLIVHDARLVSGYAGLVPSTRLHYRNLASLRVAGAVARQAGFDVEPLPGAMPRARMVAKAVHSLLPKVEIDAIDIATAALVDEPVELEIGPTGEATLYEDLPGTVGIATRATTRQLLVLAESFHPGWRVKIDGEPGRAIRVNGDFLGSVVEAGEHRVEFRFAPRSFEIGRNASLAGICLVAVVALTRSRRRD